jgi:hypothetical protein
VTAELSYSARTIAEQSVLLTHRRHRIRQRKRDLRDKAMTFCGKPSTLLGAVAAGSLLAYALPAGRAGNHREHDSKRPSLLRSQINASLQLLMFGALNRTIKQALRATGGVSPDPDLELP